MYCTELSEFDESFEPDLAKEIICKNKMAQ
jgi:hypothetical protein